MIKSNSRILTTLNNVSINGGRSVDILFIVSILLAIILRVNYEISHPHINGDYAHIASVTRNFIEGHGFTVGVVNLQNISKPEYVALYYWANGFSILLVPLYYISGSLINAMVLAQVTGIIILIFGFIRLFEILEVSKLTQSLFLLFTAFTPAPYSYLQTTDMLTAALFLWATILTIEICVRERGKIWREIVVGVLLFFLAALRYACIPNIVIIPCFFVLFSLINRNRKLFYTGIRILVYAGILTFVFFARYKIMQGETQLTESVTHFHFRWNLLKLFDPFPLKAFFYTSPLDCRLVSSLGTKIVRLSEYIGSIIILGYLAWYFLKKRNWWSGLKVKKNVDIFTALAVISIIVIVGFLSVQTLTAPPQLLSCGPHWTKIWTFVYETRYFVIAIMLIQVFFFLLTDSILKRTVNLKYAPAFILSFFVASLFFNVAYCGYTIYQCHTANSYSYWNEGKDMITLHNMINLDAENNPGKNIILATCWEYDVASDPTIFSSRTNITCSYDSIIQGKFKYTEPVILYTVMPGDTSLTEQEKEFVSKYNALEVFQWNQGIFYGGGTVYRAYLK